MLCIKPNYNKPNDTIPDAENPERNKEYKTIADVLHHIAVLLASVIIYSVVP
jgi:hypothetical protein